MVHKHVRAAIGAALALVAVPAGAQTFSDSYTFLKAVKDRDGDKVTDLVSVPGSVVINTRDKSDGEGALHYVTRGRDLNWLAFLLGKKARADIRSNRGDTPLTLAAQIGWIDGAQVLLERGASVNLANGRGETPLILAVQRRDLPMVRLLMGAGANAERTDNVTGLSALDYARRDARAASLLPLLEAPADSAKIQGPGL